MESYGYDPLNQLRTITQGSTAIESLTYNPTGDRLSKAGSGLATGAYGYDTGTHHLSSIGNTARSYDANGNTTGSSGAGQTWGYGYNGRNRLAVVQAGGSTVGNYLYNALGQRIQKTVTAPTATTQRFFYDEQSHLIGEYTVGGDNRDTIWLDDMPVATVDTNGTTSATNFVVDDQLGTPRAVVNSAGSTIWSWPYVGNAFGELAPSSSTGYVLNLRFPGQYFDAESGLSNWGYRTYDPMTGRSLQSDPSGLAGGVSTYAYGLNNSLQNIDPMGLWVCTGEYCNSFRDGLQMARKALNSPYLKAYQRNDLTQILNAYGEEGVNNVIINFHGENSTTGGWTGPDVYTHCETIRFNNINLNNNTGHDSKERWAADVVHEGQHLVDDTEGANGFPISRADAEVNAYTSQAYFQQAIHFSEGATDIWTMGGGINYNAIQSKALFSIGYGSAGSGNSNK